MDKQNLRKMKEAKNRPDKKTVEMAENILGKKVELTPDGLNDMDKMMEAAKKYEGKSEEELTQELFRVAEQGRLEGNLNNEMLDMFYSSMAPMMTDEQKARLEGLMRMLKK